MSHQGHSIRIVNNHLLIWSFCFLLHYSLIQKLNETIKTVETISFIGLYIHNDYP